MIAGCVSLKLYGHYLAVETYGVIVVPLQILSYLPFLDGAFRTTTNREILGSATREGQLRMIRFAQTFYSHFTVLLLPLALLVMAGYSLTPNAIHSSQPKVFFLTVGLAAAIAVLSWAQTELLIGLGGQAYSFLLMAFNSCVIMGSLWFFLQHGAGIWAFPFSTLAGASACYPVAICLIRRKEPTIRFICFRTDADFRSDLRRLLPDALSCFRQQVGGLFLYSLDVVLVGLFFGSATDAAIYSVVSRLIGLVRGLLQSTGEAAWPLVAEKNGKDHTFAAFLLRSNGWAIGSATGALVLTLTPFLKLYMGARWTPPQLLVWILTVRLLIMGLSSPTAYLLMGAGHFKTIARYILRELIAAICLGTMLGFKFGMIGVAFGFLAATAGGTFWPMFYAYGKTVNGSGGQLMWHVWWRGATAFTVSCSVAKMLLPFANNTWVVFAVGAIAALISLSLGLVISAFRFRPAKPSNLRSRVGELMLHI